MSAGLYGADIEALRLLADKIAEGGTSLDSVVTTVDAVLPSTDVWGGVDGDQFRAEWRTTHAVRLREASGMLGTVAARVRDNADDQERTSAADGGAGGDGPGGPAEPLGSASGTDGDLFDLFAPGAALVGFGAAAWKAFKYGQNLLNYSRALNGVGQAASSASAFMRSFMLQDGMGILGKLGTFGRFAGVAGGAFGAIGGIHQMFNPRYDGWRGGLDRAMGGVAAVGGVATVGMFLGAAAFTGPVGIGIVVGAGLVVGAYELTNLVIDNWDAISGFASDPLPYLADGWDNVTDFASDAVSNVGSALSDGASAVGDFVGGLFS
ncbi:hypothetical protein [Isoptericola croceus]|uniref:hypothetical protein n=1 Tax=Isoptericola croceus TaxID=3031406 RepID=UPI0023F82BC9|nr:hypothetical protein [Isoptericola croceus]